MNAAKRIGFVLILTVVVAFAGCLGGGLPLKDKTGQLALTISLPPELQQEVSSQSILDLVRLELLRVTVTNETRIQMKEVDLTGTSAIDILFDLELGLWNIQIEVLDSEEYAVAAGFGTGTVLLGQTTTVTVPVDLSPGILRFGLRIPDNEDIVDGSVTFLGFVPGSPDVTRAFSAVPKDIVVLDFYELEARVWPVVVELYNSKGIPIYAGEDAVIVLPGRTTEVLFEFLPAPGSLQVSVVWNLPPPRPQNVKAVHSEETGHVTVSWDPVPGAIGYLVTRGTKSGEHTVLVNRELTTRPNVVDTNVTSWRTYRYRVVAYFENGLSSRFSIAVGANTSFLPGTELAFEVAGVPFTMVSAPAAVFPMGLEDDSVGVVEREFLIGQTPVTYELWYVVREWALTEGYVFEYLGFEGQIFNEPHETRNNGAPTVRSQEPVTLITWCDAVIWTNALSEMLGKDPVYTTSTGDVIRNALEYEVFEALDEFSHGGFRLLTSAEYELAARYEVEQISSGAIFSDGIYWTPGSHASGSPVPTTGNAETTALYAWYLSGYFTQPVGLKLPNALGLYDMSGNYESWVFDRGETTLLNRRTYRNGYYRSPGYAIRVSSTKDGLHHLGLAGLRLAIDVQ